MAFRLTLPAGVVLLSVVACDGLIGIEDRTVRDGGSTDARSPSDATIPDAADAGSLLDAQQDAALVDPSTLGPLEIWLDGERGVGTSAGEVSYWQDQSNHHRDLGRGSPSLASVRQEPFPGTGRPSILFQPATTTTGGYLVRTGFTLPHPLTIAMAVLPTDATVGSFDFVFAGNRVPTIGISHYGDAFQMVAGSDATFSSLSVYKSWTAAPHVVVAVYNGSSSSLQVDSLPSQSGPLTPAPLEGLVVGGGGEMFRGYVGELLIYGSALEEVNRAAVASYLRARYAP